MWRRYARLFGANPRADTEDELRFHYEMRVRDYLRRGYDEDSARAAARERLGDLEAVREKCGDEGERFMDRQRRREWLSEVRQDVKYGARVLLRSPLFATVAIITLALPLVITPPTCGLRAVHMGQTCGSPMQAAGMPAIFTPATTPVVTGPMVPPWAVRSPNRAAGMPAPGAGGPGIVGGSGG